MIELILISICILVAMFAHIANMVIDVLFWREGERNKRFVKETYDMDIDNPFLPLKKER